jgi:hypothetical protein
MDGYTPVKGVDYYTDAERQAMEQAVLDELPVQVADDGFTDITGLRKMNSMSISRSEAYITLESAMEGGKTDSTVVVLDADGYPTQILTGDHICTLSWNGFDHTVLENWEGGEY